MNDNKERYSLYKNDNIVTNEFNLELSPLDDDYNYYKAQLDYLTDPLSDDYCKYDNE